MNAEAWTVSNGKGCMGLNAKEAAMILFLLKKLRWFQLLKDFNCTVTSTWTNNEDNCEFHTLRTWGSRVRKKQKRKMVVFLHEILCA